MIPPDSPGYSSENPIGIGVVIMENVESTWVAFRKIGWLALLGLGVVVLSGPILAVLSVLLSVGAVVLGFALLGFMVWSIFQFAIHGHEAASQSIQAMSRNATHAIGRFGQTCARIVAFPFKAIVWAGDGILAAIWFLAVRFWRTFRFLSKTSVLTVTGALVGVAAGVLAGAAQQNMDVTVPINAVIGAVIGTLVGGALILMERKSPQPIRFKPINLPPLKVQPIQPQMKV
jgi:hypothetical protein